MSTTSTQTIEQINTLNTLRLSYKGSRATTEQTNHKVTSSDKQKKYCHGNPSEGIADLESSYIKGNCQRKCNKKSENGLNSLSKRIADLDSSNSISILKILEMETEKESGKGVKQLYTVKLNNNVGKIVVTQNLTQKKYFQEKSSRGNADLTSTIIVEIFEEESNKKSGKGLNSLSKRIADLGSSNTISILEILEKEIDNESGKGVQQLPMNKSNKNVGKSVVTKNHMQTKYCQGYSSRGNTNMKCTIIVEILEEESNKNPEGDADQESPNSILISEQSGIRYNLPLFVREQQFDEPENININTHNLDALNTQNIQSFGPLNLESRRFLANLALAIGVYMLLRGMGSWIGRRRNEEVKRSWNAFLELSSLIVYTKDEMFLLSLQKGSVSGSTTDVVHQYYLIISREHGYNSTSKIYTSDVFEEALRECGIGPPQIAYTIVFPNDCRMFLLVPVYKGGYINNIDQKDKPQLIRTALKQNEINMERFTQNSKEINNAPKWCENGKHNFSQQKSSKSNSLI